MKDPRPLPKVDFLQPAGAAALYAPDSLAWQIYKNPVSLFIGGITAVLLELGEERVRSCVRNHSVFPSDPLTRLLTNGRSSPRIVHSPHARGARRCRVHSGSSGLLRGHSETS